MPRGSNNIRVFLRLKPSATPSSLLGYEPGSGEVAWHIPVEKKQWLVNNTKTSYNFRFDGVLPTEVDQQQVYDTIAAESVESALSGYNATVFAYGQTGSGKTFTITGGPARYEDRGVIPRALQQVFTTVRKDRESQYRVFVSYLEIYNETGYDLLNPEHETTTLEQLPRVKLQEDEDGNVHLKGLSMHPVASEEEALNLLFLGDTNRAICETPMNPVSSRSHCIFTISLEAKPMDGTVIRRSKLHLVDLAGSERVSKTGAAGMLLREASHINSSLHFLQMVIVALHEKAKKRSAVHVPYRNSMLTSVLRDSLGGNCKTAMVATVSIEELNADESISTCRFAQSVAAIKNKAVRNEQVDPAVLVRQLQQQVADREAELAFLRGEAGDAELSEADLEDIRQRARAWLTAGARDELQIGAESHRRVQAAFAALAELALATGDGSSLAAGAAAGSGRAGPQADPAELRELQEEVVKLSEQVSRRDHEIAILVGMVQKQKAGGSTGDAAESAAVSTGPTSTGSAQLASHATSSSASPATVTTPFGVTLPAAALSDKEACRAAFAQDNPATQSIAAQRDQLRALYEQAKQTGEQVNAARQHVAELKSQIEHLRIAHVVETAGDASTSTPADEREVSPAEQRLMKQLEEHMSAYRAGFDSLRGMKTEIEYLKKLLQKKKDKVASDFENWYGAVKAAHGTLAGTGAKSPSRAPTAAPATLGMTGDVQADSDIAAYQKAREKLLARMAAAGAPPASPAGAAHK